MQFCHLKENVSHYLSTALKLSSRLSSFACLIHHRKEYMSTNTIELFGIKSYINNHLQKKK